MRRSMVEPIVQIAHLVPKIEACDRETRSLNFGHGHRYPVWRSLRLGRIPRGRASPFDEGAAMTLVKVVVWEGASLMPRRTAEVLSGLSSSDEVLLQWPHSPAAPPTHSGGSRASGCC